jgi:hypothetical protein
MCEKKLPERDEFRISEGLLVPSVFVFDTFIENESVRKVEMLYLVYSLMITHIPVP